MRLHGAVPFSVGVGGGAGLEDCLAGGDGAHFEDLRPAVAEEAVADDQAVFAGGKLPRDRLHAEGAAAGDDGNGSGGVDLFEGGGDIATEVTSSAHDFVAWGTKRTFSGARPISLVRFMAQEGTLPVTGDIAPRDRCVPITAMGVKPR